MMSMKVWVTRAEPGASQTAARLRALGHEALTAPVLAVWPLTPMLDLDEIGALAFTSSNGVRAFAALCPDRHLPVFAVGEATARAARDAGFAAVSSADGDVAALSALIASAQDRWAGAVLFAGAAEPAGDLIGALEAAGVSARSAAVYETRRLAFQAPQGAQAVLVHSPKAADALASAPLEGLVAYCISQAAAEALTGSGARIVVAAESNEASLLGLLDHDQPQPLRLGRSFWTALILGLLCVIAGYAFARLAPILLTAHS
jgi:uroporphyrinogen-III synthase